MQLVVWYSSYYVTSNKLKSKLYVIDDRDFKEHSAYKVMYRNDRKKVIKYMPEFTHNMLGSKFINISSDVVPDGDMITREINFNMWIIH